MTTKNSKTAIDQRLKAFPVRGKYDFENLLKQKMPNDVSEVVALNG